jgi:integrase
MNNKFNFTKSAIEALPIPTDRKEYFDTKLQGLQLRVTSKGIKTFCYYRWIKSDKKPERITLGRYPDLSIEEARVKVTNYNKMAVNGLNPIEPIKELKEQLTFAEFFEIFYEKHCKKFKKSHKDDRQKFDKWVAPHKFSRKKISTITSADVSELHNDSTHEVKQKVDKKTGEIKLIECSHITGANRLLALLSVAFNKAIEWGYCKENPAANVKKFPETERERSLSSEEMKIFLTALNSLPEDQKDYYMMLLFTGSRKGKVHQMKYKDISFIDKIWKVGITKNGKPQYIPLTDLLIKILKRRLKNKIPDNDYVFPSLKSENGHIVNTYKQWDKFRNSIGMNDFRIHDFRHTIASWEISLGTDSFIVGKGLNHLDSKSTSRYAHVNIAAVRESRKRAEEAILKHKKKN